MTSGKGGDLPVDTSVTATPTLHGGPLGSPVLKGIEAHKRHERRLTYA